MRIKDIDDGIKDIITIILMAGAVIMVSIVLFSCSYNIQFSDNVNVVNESDFLRKISIDGRNYQYSDSLGRPSLVFVYSDVVKHCRKQAAVFNSVADIYGNQILFWAVDERNADSLLTVFGDTGKRPVYIFVNQNLAQKISVDDIKMSTIQNIIFNHFGIVPKQKI